MKLEIQLNNSTLRDTLDGPVATKIIQQGDFTLKSEKSFQSANLLLNDPKQSAVLSEVSSEATGIAENPTSQPKGMELKSVSDAPKIDSKSLSNSE